MIFAVLTLGRPTAAAEPPSSPSDEVQERYERGKAALAAGTPEAALRHFRACLGQVAGDEPRTWQMQLAVALAYERMHRHAAAIEYYGAFMTGSQPHERALSAKWKRRRDYVAKTVERLRADVMATRGQISIASTPRGAAVFIDGARAGVEGDAVTPHATFARPGPHRVVVKLDGYEDAEVDVEVQANRLHPISLTLSGQPDPSPEPAAAPTSPATGPIVAESAGAGEAGPDILSWVLLSGGTALTVTAAGLAVGVAETARQQRALLDGERDRWDDLEDRRVPMLISSIAVGAAGLAMLGVGIGCAVGDCSGRSDDEAHEAELLGVQLSPLRDGAWVGARVGF